jgi:hypothetical protein
MSENSMLYNTDVWIIVLVLFILLLLFTYIGLRMGKTRNKKKVIINEHSEIIVSSLALQGLVLAFTFSVSSARFEARRHAIISEASGIRLAVRTADLYPPEERLLFRRELQGYLEARIEIFKSGRNNIRLAKARRISEEHRNNLWALITQNSTNPAYQLPTEQMLATMKEMIERSILREGARLARVPDSIVLMLLVQSIASAFFIGYVNSGQKKPDLLTIVLFHILVTMVIYITLDLDRPLQGLTRLEDIHEILISTRELFKEN